MTRSISLLLAFTIAAFSGVAQADPAVWSALREGGVVALIRHARAPGTGDPAGFRLGDCASQRNLDETGRRQATSLGDRFRAERVLVVAVKSSRWCRALETARLAFPDKTVEPLPMLDSVFGRRAEELGQTRAAQALAGSWRGPGVLMLVTHQVNVTALAGVYPREGEIVVLKPDGRGGTQVIGRLIP